MNERSAAASSIKRGMRAPLHASATDRPLPKFGIIRGNGHKAASRYRSPRYCPGSPSSLRLPSGFTTTVKERAR